MSLIDYFADHIVPRMYRGKGALHPAPTGKLTDVVSRMNMASLQALRKKLDLGKIRYVFTSHNGYTDDPQSAFRHIDTIPKLEKGRPFDDSAPYDCFAEREE